MVAVGVSGLARADSDAADRVERFMTGFGDGCVAVINHVGRVGARIVVMAPSGEFGDVLASSTEVATQICARFSLPVRDWDRETSGLLAPSDADRVTMGTRQR